MKSFPLRSRALGALAARRMHARLIKGGRASREQQDGKLFIRFSYGREGNREIAPRSAAAAPEPGERGML